jgi:YidC/Oxa1 family membrane protein insertase
MSFLKDLVVQAVNFFYNFSGSYGIAIIMLTIVVRLIILPLNISSMKFSNISKKLNPKMEELKKKYKDDKDKLNEATVELWQQYNVNPAAGCLPLLIQFPVLIAVIGALQLPELYQVAEPTFLGLNLMSPTNGVYAWELGLPYLILPILSVITTYTSSKIMSAGNPQANMGTMNIVMTGLMGWITLRFPSGIALYWVVGNVFSICQYLVFNKIYQNKELVPAEGVNKSEKKRNKER